MILSVSRRTDIPAFYSTWFINRVRAGFVFVRNPMNYHQVSKVRISPDVVDCIVFWTKNALSITQYLDEISPEAKAIGAVNVVRCQRSTVNCQPKLTGYNSDVIGFVESIKPLLKPHHEKALILGTGGASKAIHYGLEEKLGMETLFVSRTSRENMVTYNDITKDLLQDYTVIVNCSPVGMFPKVNECPALPYEAMNENHLLYDLVYNPLETLFMKKGAAQGATVKNGLEMLHLQAIASWEFWTQ